MGKASIPPTEALAAKVKEILVAADFIVLRTGSDLVLAEYHDEDNVFIISVFEHALGYA